jgi:hypothetical protein
MAPLRAQIASEGAGIACALAAGDTNSFHAHCDHVQTTVDPADTGVLITGRNIWAGRRMFFSDPIRASAIDTESSPGLA